MQNPNEDTEWNDVLRQHGILPPRAPSPTAQLEAAMEEAVDKAYANRLEGKSLNELDELEDDGLEDEEFIQMYREKRMAEIQEQASRERFSEVVHISKPEYTEEITNASKSWPVFVHIVGSGVVQSKLLSALLLRVAPRFKDIKFVEIDSRQINEKYPSSQCPTILIYKNTNVLDQIVTLDTIGGNSTNLHDIDRLLVKEGLVERTDERLLENQDSD
ncbi:Phosducin-like protein 2 [Wickerhamiella sorbophila]|uniref:Phosducin-like protein 2 n=1 Tax=Wickerhamiella sorbophila TaxID=45607 RepID=A0A2T0FHY2_9ASCO|nr:Phosducin-like protein 2 [Wickerhamiella sorbophila]PRT54567.1 Phosducin-like protein 2 [Wickerhamiella sorbophila]